MSDDLIRRSDAIEALGEEPYVWTDDEFAQGMHSQWIDDVNAIKTIPAAKRSQGEWIHNPNGIDRDFIWWKCSNCGNEIFSETEYDREKFHAFCSRCGARMK